MNDVTDTNIFLAGASGLAGVAVLRHLLATFPVCRIRAGCFRNNGNLVENNRIEWIAADLRDAEECRRAVSGCQAVIMTAASTGGAGMLTTEPWRQVNDNLIMNARLLEACAQCCVKRVIWVGSATLYQECSQPIREEDLDWNQDPYAAYRGVGWVMRFIEKLCQFWHREKGLEIIIARVANIYGPYARFDPKHANFIPALIRKAADRMDPFEVWGSPDVVRDVLYVDDFARAVMLMLQRQDICWDVFNVGSGRQATVDEVVRCVLHHADFKPRSVVYRQDKPTTIRFRAIDCSKIKARLGWEPKIGLEEGIGCTTAWWQDHRMKWSK
ncbi:MAG: NAD-dependent epimerase/dehydratase family protein [Kiritimatiellia bacterium]|nr:NAD-dependent epimerase/dehydratase family protein [Kiritimatiellia bacterium]